MRAALLVALLASSALAEPDGGVGAPIVVRIEPDGSRLVSPEAWVQLGQDSASDKARIASLENSAKDQLPGWAVVALTVGGIVAGGAATAGVLAATGHLK